MIALQCNNTAIISTKNRRTATRQRVAEKTKLFGQIDGWIQRSCVDVLRNIALFATANRQAHTADPFHLWFSPELRVPVHVRISGEHELLGAFTRSSESCKMKQITRKLCWNNVRFFRDSRALAKTFRRGQILALCGIRRLVTCMKSS